MAKYFGLRGRSLEHALIWAVIMPAYILFGYNNGVAGGLLSFPSWIATFPNINTTTTTGAVKTYNAQVQGTVVAVYTLGCFFGSLNCIWLGDRLGRKRTIIFGAGGHVIGALLQSSSSSLAQLTVGRLVSGFFFGHLTATAPNWQAECSRAEHRGATVLLEGLFISMGLAISAWINLAMSYVTGSASWRFPLAFSALWAIIVILTMPFMPDSPRWLVKKGRVDEARSVMAALSDTEPDSSAVTDAIREIEVSLALAGEARFLHVFRNGDLRLFHRTCLAAAGQIFQQMSGVNVLGYYEASIFQNDLGLSANNSRIMVAAAFTWQTLCSPIGVLTVDRFGRRKLMIFSAIGMGCCMAIAAGCSSVPHNTAAVALAAAAIFMYSFFFPTGFLGLTFLYAAEVAPLSYRVPITSISTAAAWLFNFVVAEVTPVGFSTIGYRYFIVYAVLNFALILPVVYFLFPETNGCHLEEVDKIFLKSKSTFDVVAISKQIPRGGHLHDAIEKAEDNKKDEANSHEENSSGPA